MQKNSDDNEPGGVKHDNLRFRARGSYPYRRHPRLGGFGERKSTTTTTTTKSSSNTRDKYHSNFGFQHVEAETEAPKDVFAGPFVTMPREAERDNVTELARQPKKAEMSDDSSRRHEIRVLPPEEFHHLLAKVDGIDRKVSRAYS